MQLSRWSKGVVDHCPKTHGQTLAWLAPRCPQGNHGFTAGAAEQALMPLICLVWLTKLQRIAVFHQLKATAGEPAVLGVWRVWVGALADSSG